MSDFTWTTNDFELSEYLTSNDNRTLPTAFTEGEIIREINSLEKKYAALKRENEALLQIADRQNNELVALKRENEAIKNLVVGRVNGEWPDGFDNEPDDWEKWSLQLYGHEAGDLLLGQEAWDHIVRGLKRAFLLTEEFTGGTTPTYFSAQEKE